MQEQFLLSDAELLEYGSSDDWSDKAYALLQQQEDSWGLLRNGYSSLENVETRVFELDGFSVRVQFNPARITSSAAKVDEKSIRERPCFLCAENLPAGQRGLKYGAEYFLLCNPYPIFPEHFTIPHVRHTPQQIRSSFSALLQLSKDLGERYTVFYNGPRCGASAPDHLHFQAGNKGFMPIDDEYESVITSIGEKIGDVDGLLVFAARDFLRRFVSFESDDAVLLRKAFDVFYEAAQKLFDQNDEPMMNILSSYQEGEWRVIVFPRAKHRPSFFFDEGDERMLISPAAVDLGGVVITPVERDFERITGELLMEMFEEVSAAPNAFAQLTDAVAQRLTSLSDRP